MLTTAHSHQPLPSCFLLPALSLVLLGSLPAPCPCSGSLTSSFIHTHKHLSHACYISGGGDLGQGEPSCMPLAPFPPVIFTACGRRKKVESRRRRSGKKGQGREESCSMKVGHHFLGQNWGIPPLGEPPVQPLWQLFQKNPLSTPGSPWSYRLRQFRTQLDSTS